MITITLKITENGRDIERDYQVDDVYQFEAISALTEMYDVLKDEDNHNF